MRIFFALAATIALGLMASAGAQIRTAHDVDVGAATAEQGQVVFFRPSRPIVGALRVRVREGERDLGRLPDGGYLVHVAEPGVHEFHVGNEPLRLLVEPGHTYYVEQSIRPGALIAAKRVLTLSDQSTFVQR